MAYMIDEVVETLKQELMALKPEGKGTDQAEALRQKINYLERLASTERRENRLLSPTIFISYSGKDGETLLQSVCLEVKSLKVPHTTTTFSVNTGMAREGKPGVREHVVNKIEECCIFLGILTKEYRLSIEDKVSNSYAPGAWVLIEAGIAIGLGLRIIFLVENGIQESFWQKPIGDWRHAKFDHHSLNDGLISAKELITSHYNELLENT